MGCNTTFPLSLLYEKLGGTSLEGVKNKMKGSVKQIMVIELARLGKWSIYVKRVVNMVNVEGTV